MSRVGKRPITISDTLEVTYADRTFAVKGPKGELTFDVPELVDLAIEDGTLTVQADYKNNPEAKMLMGTTQAIIGNMVQGVSEGFTKHLNLVGVGYRASVAGKKLELNLGYSHPINFLLPDGITATVTANTQVVLESCDKQQLGQVAANIRSFRPPEPYKGKGILFKGEVIRRKVGKSGKK